MQDFGQRMRNLQFLLDDGHQDINTDGNLDLGLDRVLGCTEKCLDSQVLFEPFKEQFDLPAAFVQSSNSQGIQPKMVG